MDSFKKHSQSEAVNRQAKFWLNSDYHLSPDALGMQRCLMFYLHDALDLRQQSKLIYSREECILESLIGNEVQQQLDHCSGQCLLRQALVAKTIEQVLLHGDGQRYRLLAWSILPNHVQVMLELSGVDLAYHIVDQWKSSIIRALYAEDASHTPLWQAGYLNYSVEDTDDFRSSVAHLYRHNHDRSCLQWSSQRLSGNYSDV